MRSDLSMLSPQDAQAPLEEIGRVRRSTRTRLGAHTWMSFMVWAAIFAAATVWIAWRMKP